jgi:sugar O-acyltransferase (sialic acid O-acetyltransferase NeuD family)
VKKIAVFGASGHGKVVAELAEESGYQVVFFDDAYPDKQKIEHWPVVGDFVDLLNSKENYKHAVVAIGNNQIRFNLSDKLLNSGFNLPVLIHPNAVVSRYAQIEDGTVVFANAVINAFSKISCYCIINTSAIVEHDCMLGDAVHLSPNVALAGGTKIDKLSWLGLGSVTRQLVRIGSNVIVGANATVVKDIPKNVTVVGTPAAQITK